MLEKPKITVLMPVFNCEDYIKEAVLSIINQTYNDFELLIIDDASSDNTVKIVKSIKDTRIKFIVKPKNTGYTNSLNYGLSIAKGDYIARMDADDISMPQRFEKQVSFLENNKDVLVCGTNYSIINSGVKKVLPESNEEIKLKLLTETCFGHPTIMLRKSIIDKHKLIYDITKEPAEDYALWVTMLQYGKLHNLQEFLLQYRLHDAQVSVTRRQTQLQSKLETRIQVLKYLKADLKVEDYDILKRIINKDTLTFNQLEKIYSINNRLIIANKNSFFKKNEFKNYLNKIFTLAVEKYFTNRKQFYPNTIIQYYKVKDKSMFKLSLKQIFILAIKSLISYKVR